MSEETEIKDPKAVLDALADAKKEAKKFREERDALQVRLEGDPFKSRAVAAEAKLALTAQGIKEPERLVKYMKLEEVDFDDDGKLTGFNESLEAVKRDFPELFDAKRRVGGKIDAHATGDIATKTSTEQQVERLFSR